VSTGSIVKAWKRAGVTWWGIDFILLNLKWLHDDTAEPTAIGAGTQHEDAAFRQARSSRHGRAMADNAASPASGW
jgi:hypothetical protein